MIPKLLSATWTAMAPGLGNHLWQSTLFAIVVGVLTLALRKNRAQVRYGLWLTASLKFLIPFSLLVGMGSHLAWPRTTAGPRAGLYSAMEQVGQPFAQRTLPLVSGSAASADSQGMSYLPAIVLALWLCGFLAVLLVWYVRWRRISVAVRQAALLRGGRELDALRRLERVQATRQPIEMLLSPASSEPGIFGIVRPVLLWPQGISERLDDNHLEAILAHELCHVRRRDNLAAALHMLVEAIFWFHPLVWWLGARLLDERERACDEAVLASGGDRHVYAESILKICEFCVGSPLPCVSGITGAGLQGRIARIMIGHAARTLSLGRKLVLTAAAFLAIAVPVAFGLLNATQSPAASQTKHTAGLASLAVRSVTGQAPSACVLTRDWQSAAGGNQAFEVASVMENESGNEFGSMNVRMGYGDIYPPNGGVFSATNVPLLSYIYFAHKLTGSQLQLLLPQLSNLWWVRTDRFDVEARAVGNATNDQLRLMVQSLLADRFKLAIHCETRQLPALALVLAKPEKVGPQLRSHPNDSSCSTARAPISPANPGAELVTATIAGRFPSVCGGIVSMPPSTSGRLRVGARDVSIGLLAATMAQFGNLDRAVLDQTGLTGNFDFTFEWTPQVNAPQPPLTNAPGDQPGATFLAELNEQLGLKLEPQTGPVDIFVIDHAERPADSQAQNTTGALPRYASVSIRPSQSGGDNDMLMFGRDEFVSKNASLQQVIRTAYGMEDDRIFGAPRWLGSEKYDLEAKGISSGDDGPRKLDLFQSGSQQRRMLQAVLADRLKLAIHRETRELSVYALAIAQDGSRLREAKPREVYIKGPKGPDSVSGPGIGMDGSELRGRGVGTGPLVFHLSRQLHRTVLDETGLPDDYDFTLKLPDGIRLGIDNPASPESSEPAISSALEQQLGLKLEPRKVSMEVIVIDHVEKPGQN